MSSVDSERAGFNKVDQFPSVVADAFSLAYFSALRHIGCNKKCSHHSCAIIVGDQIQYMANNTPDSHAEANVLDLLVSDQNETRTLPVDLLVIRVSADGLYRVRHSKPCDDCTKIIKTKGIRYIYYSGIDGNLIRENAADFESGFKSSTERKALECSSTDRLFSKI